jgi:hypothetical protein
VTTPPIALAIRRGGKSRLQKIRRRGVSRDPKGLVSRLAGTVSELTESESNSDESFSFLKKVKG